MVIISEFGLLGSFAPDGDEADPDDKSFRNKFRLARRDWIAGAILWCYQDYKSRRNIR
jgi:hypothetical protein